MSAVKIQSNSHKWSTATLLEAARARTALLRMGTAMDVRKMLEELLVNAGWSEEEFINALCEDIINRANRTKSGTFAKVSR
jgi:hypothetical protein